MQQYHHHSDLIHILFNQAASEPVCMLLWSVANSHSQVLPADVKFNIYLNDRQELSEVLHQIRIDLTESCPIAVQNVYVVQRLSPEFVRSMDLIINVGTNSSNNNVKKRLLPPKTMVVEIDMPPTVNYMNMGHRFLMLSWVDKMSHQIFMDCQQIQQKKKEQMLCENLRSTPRL